jgi:hypothetical protein
MTTHTDRLGSEYGHRLELLAINRSLHHLFWEVS